MKLKQHIDIGRYVLDNTDEILLDNFGLNRFAYLLGNIAPDLNCIYPAHRLKTTEKRFYKRLYRTNTLDINIIKSFELGVITHYICDYFCFAHNNESLGVYHKQYEEGLYDYYNAHLDEMVSNLDKLKSAWLKNKSISIQENIKDGCMDSESHAELLLEQVKLMNKEYANHTKLNKDKGWQYKNEQMQMDIEYTLFMAENITKLILEPFRCLLVQC